MKVKKCIIILLIMIIISGINYTVKSANGDSYSLKMSVDKTTLKAGDTVTISLKLDNIEIQSGEKGLGSYEGSIVYDKNIFEDLKMIGNSNWDTPFQNEGRFTSTRTDGKCVSETQEIATITLKVKSNAKEGNTTIQIKDFSASNAVENIPTSNTSIIAKIEKESDKNNTLNTNTSNNGNTNTNNGGTTNNKVQNTTNNKTQNTVKNSTTTQTKNIITNSTAKQSLPKTGISTTLLSIFIVVCVISFVYGYFMYKNTY